ncbi:MAG: four-carbon acid sugar kinase family protein [Actinomycetaceae bacterium]|nr:four-carbon acid sugar kinase family protein [Actinomycetaceae bacterium]
MPTLDELLAGYPPSLDVTATEVPLPERVLIVLDDDPTGTQSVADLPVLTSWGVDALEWGLRQGKPAIYVMTNSRSLDPEAAGRCNEEVALAAYEAAQRVGVRVDFVSRSDSTLRGHFPLEPLTLAEVVRSREGASIDGIVIVPAFGDAGRVTIGGTHYARNADGDYLPVGESEFARDATFGYQSSRMADWVAEKSSRWAVSDVLAISLTDLRADGDGVVAQLRGARDAQPIVVDIVDEQDLRRLAIALAKAEAAGSRFIYRVGPPFPRARIGQDVPAPLEAQDVATMIAAGPAADAVGGLIVVGSHVDLTTRQLAELRRRSAPTDVVIDVEQILSEGRDSALVHAVDAICEALPDGNVVVSTSRLLITGNDADDSLRIAREVSAAVVEVVQRVLAAYTPRFVVAKGGITSSDVASVGLGIERAYVRGPMLPGIVSAWEPMDGPARGIPYVVFAGNVGNQDSLADVVEKLTVKE